MKKFRLLTTYILAIGLLFSLVQPALAAPPSLPSSFYGKVTVNGQVVPVGTVISARINGVEYAHFSAIIDAGQSWYTLDVPGDDPDTPGTQGGVEGDTIVFFIGPIQAAQTGIWHAGTNVVLNLTGTGTLPKFKTFLPLVRR